MRKIIALFCLVSSLCSAANHQKQPDDQIVTLEKAHEKKVFEKRLKGWFPEDGPLFDSLVADPRQPCYSTGFRLYDQAVAKRVASVSFGQEFPLYRWDNQWRWKGDFQISIEAGIWSVFDLVLDSFPLVNTDFYLAFPLTYRTKELSFRLRAYHTSSHLGDEFIVNNPSVTRLNPSKNAIDFTASWDVDHTLRLYGGLGAVISEHFTFEREKGGFLEAGFELRPIERIDIRHKLKGNLILASHIRLFRNRFDNNYDINSDFAFGMEIQRLDGHSKKASFLIEYHDGHSLEGQFTSSSSDYIALKVIYGR